MRLPPGLYKVGLQTLLCYPAILHQISRIQSKLLSDTLFAMGGKKDQKKNQEKSHLVSIRMLTSGDLEDCMRIERAAFKEYEWCSPECFSRCLGETPELCYGISYGKQLVGHAISTKTKHPTCTDSCMDAAARPEGRNTALLSFAVLPEFQRRGFGSRLMAEYILKTRASADRIVLIARPRMTIFYSRFGFVCSGASSVGFAGGRWKDFVLKF